MGTSSKQTLTHRYNFTLDCNHVLLATVIYFCQTKKKKKSNALGKNKQEHSKLSCTKIFSHFLLECLYAFSIVSHITYEVVAHCFISHAFSDTDV